MTIRMPESDVAHWAKADQVSTVLEQALWKSDAPSVLIRKELGCLASGQHRSREDNSDTFPHPGSQIGKDH